MVKLFLSSFFKKGIPKNRDAISTTACHMKIVNAYAIVLKNI